MPKPGSSRSSDDAKAAAKAEVEQVLNDAYSQISTAARPFVAEVVAYERECSKVKTATCTNLAQSIGWSAVQIANAMEKVDEAVRRASIPPGEVRAARRRYGMEDSFWDDVVRFVAQFRRY
jgi:hypothetical protein